MLFWAALIVFGVVCILIYNGLIAKKNQVDYANSSIDVMLRKRYDLIPNLVSTLAQYMKHERETLERITALRSRAVDSATPPQEQPKIDQEMTGLLKGLSVQFENYPTLKADEGFMQLQSALTEIEEQLSAARRAFNASVTTFNNSIEMFPSNIVAGMMGFTSKQLLQTEAIARGPIDVNKSFRKSS